MSDPYEDLSEMTPLSPVIEHDQMIKITSNFARLGDRCYLENAGAALYPQSLITSIHEDLMNNVYMNPHTDKYTKDCIEQIRCLLLKHFNTDPSMYTVIFTSGSTQSLKLILESFQFASDDDASNCGAFVYLRDNHTSVLGLREIAADKNADVIHISHEDFLKTLSTGHNKTPTLWRNKYKSSNYANNLFVYPAQNNFNGYKYPIDCMEYIRNGCLNNFIKKHLGKINSNWYTLLDAASYVCTSRLDLSKVQPDFVAMSFYKIFGYPTGLGALLVKNTSENVLNQKRYFGGGTVEIVLTTEDFHVKRHNLSERLEDGTQSYLSIIALKQCFDTMYRLIPKSIYDDRMETISYHTFFLAKDLYTQLKELKHRNGRHAVVLYMDSDFNDIKKQGGVVTFNLVREDGSYIGYSEFQHMADLFSINVRTGCFCNSGSCQRHLSATNKEMKDMYKAGHVCGDGFDLIKGKPTGAVRASFGYFNTFKDVDKLIHMICQCFVKTKIKRPNRIPKLFRNIDTIKRNKTYSGIVHTHKILNEQEFFGDSFEPPLDISIGDSDITLEEVAIFPIKSCGAFKIKSAWKIGPKGFLYDREWMIVKDNGVCLTQKTHPQMCMIRPKIDLVHRVMTLHFKGRPSISIPLDTVSDNITKETSFCRSKVCTDVVQGYDCGDSVGDWISEALEVSFLRLIKQSSDDHRVQKKKKDGDHNLLSLSNQAQYLLINKATVRWLKEKIEDPDFMDDTNNLTDRFRGNIIIDMDQEHVEKSWHKLVIGKHEFRVEGQCSRCQMVCINQQNGEKTVEPLRTISEQLAGKMRFGIYLSYIGTVDGSMDRVLNIGAAVKPVINDDDISR